MLPSLPLRKSCKLYYSCTAACGLLAAVTAASSALQQLIAAHQLWVESCKLQCQLAAIAVSDHDVRGGPAGSGQQAAESPGNLQHQEEDEQHQQDVAHAEDGDLCCIGRPDTAAQQKVFDGHHMTTIDESQVCAALVGQNDLNSACMTCRVYAFSIETVTCNCSGTAAKGEAEQPLTLFKCEGTMTSSDQPVPSLS